MLKSAAFAFLLILSGCHRKAASVAKPHGSSLPDLVTAESAPAFLPGNAAVTEVVQANGSWEFYHERELAALARSEPAAFEAFRETREKAALKGVSSRILVSARGGARFKEVRRLARGAFDSGYDRLDFLVCGSASSDEQRALYLEFPTAVGSFVPPDIEPKLVKNSCCCKSLSKNIATRRRRLIWADRPRNFCFTCDGNCAR